jgi:thymidylate synthase ThyX
MNYVVETFTEDEARALAPYVTNLDRPVFALRNLPEVTKGALFARYSRTDKSLRRVLLDEFLGDDGVRAHADGDDAAVGTAKAEGLYERVLSDYGDDSVAQLGFAHVACEQVSNVLTKVIERGRLASYLEQSTRYIAFDDRPGGRYRYALEPDVAASPLAADYESTLDAVFSSYAELLARLEAWLQERFPRDPGDPEGVWRRTLRAKACDALRGLLPAATVSNVGMAASGQAYESLLLHLQTHPLAEARAYGAMLHDELAAVIPAFIKRVRVPERGGVWSDYLAATRDAMLRLADEFGLDDPDAELPAHLQEGPEAHPENDGVTLMDWDPDAEAKIAAACLYPAARVPDEFVLARVRALPAEDRARILAAAVGDRGNRRHKPGRGFERVGYRFDVVADYGAFRDLQRHRMCTVEWQELSPSLGYDLPDLVEEAGMADEFRATVGRSAALWEKLRDAGFARQAPYALCLAYRIRFSMQVNAREAFHLIELRSSAQGHPAYRRVAQAMHRTIAEVHPAIADAMRFVDYGDVDLERLEAERRNAAKAAAAATVAVATGHVGMDEAGDDA